MTDVHSLAGHFIDKETRLKVAYNDKSIGIFVFLGPGFRETC